MKSRPTTSSAAVPQRIHALRSDMKIIALLRHPVERTLSQYFLLPLEAETLPLEEAWPLNPNDRRALEVIRKPGGTTSAIRSTATWPAAATTNSCRAFRAVWPDRVLSCAAMICPAVTARPGGFSSSNIAPSLTTRRSLRKQRCWGSRTVPEEVHQRLKAQLEPTFAWLDQALDIRW